MQLTEISSLIATNLSTAGLPLGVCFDTNGDVYVGEAGPGQIEVFSAASNYSLVKTITSASFGDSLRGIVKQGTRLYVADFNNSQVFELDETNTTNYTFNPPVVVINDGNIANPTQLSMDSSLNLYVASTGSGSVVEYNSQTVADTPFTLNHACFLPGYGPQGVAVDSQGNIYAGSTLAPYLVAQIAPCATGGGSSKAPLKVSALNLEGGHTQTPSPTVTANPTATLTPTPNFSTLAQARPNISRDGAPIQFLVNLNQAGRIELSLFTIMGERVYQTSVQGNAGVNSLGWNLQNLSGSPVVSGLYLYQVAVQNDTRTVTQTGKVAVIH